MPEKNNPNQNPKIEIGTDINTNLEKSLPPTEISESKIPDFKFTPSPPPPSQNENNSEDKK